MSPESLVAARVMAMLALASLPTMAYSSASVTPFTWQVSKLVRVRVAVPGVSWDWVSTAPSRLRVTPSMRLPVSMSIARNTQSEAFSGCPVYSMAAGTSMSICTPIWVLTASSSSAVL